MNSIDDIIDRWEEANEAGQTLTPEELCVDHPEHLEAVRWQILALIAIDDFLELEPSKSNRRESDGVSAFVPPSSLELSGRYQLERLHASGGLGQVFLARDTTLNRLVAIKFPRRTGMTVEQLSRFEREARITGQLEHPGIVPIHALQWEQSSEPCYVMRFIDGVTLNEAVRQLFDEDQNPKGMTWNDYFNCDQLRHLLHSIVSLGNIVAYAHGRGFIHRDIKPANVMLGPFGETLLLDWGIAKELTAGTADPTLSAELKSPPSAYAEMVDIRNAFSAGSEFGFLPLFTSTGQLLGTPAFASPEQLLGRQDEVKAVSDVFSLGSTLFFALAGKSPIESLGWDNFLKKIRTEDTDLTDLLPRSTPSSLRAICQKAMRISGDGRYPSATAFANDLERYLAREPISVMRESLGSRTTRMSRKRPAMVGAIIATIGVAFVSLILASTLINRKNRELYAGNEKLSLTLTDLENTNELAIQTLRSMFDNLIATRFASQTELAESDRDFLSRALQQYLELAELQHDSEQTQAIRAEAYLQSGNILLELSEEAEAIVHLQKAISMFETLLEKHDVPRYRIDLAHAYNALGHVQLKRARFEQSLRAGKKGIQILERMGSSIETLSSEDLIAFKLIQADLCKTVAGYYEQSGELEQAIGSYEQALRVLEELLLGEPENQFIKKALASCCRSLGDLLGNFPGTDAATSKEMIYADRAIELFSDLAERYPQDRSYHYGLAWARYDRGHVQERKGELRLAIDDVGSAIRIVELLRERFPLIEDYRVGFRIMRMRRARLAAKAGSLEEAAVDILKLEPGVLVSDVDIDFCVRTLQSVNSQVPNQLEYEVLLVDVLRQRATWHESRNDYSAAERDFTEAYRWCENMVERLIESSVAETRRVVCLLDLARVHASQGDEGKATSEYDKAHAQAALIKEASKADSDLLAVAFERIEKMPLFSK